VPARAGAQFSRRAGADRLALARHPMNARHPMDAHHPMDARQPMNSYPHAHEGEDFGIVPKCATARSVQPPSACFGKR
jgi:hypothetical protein